MNLWKPPRRVSGPAFVGIGFGILFFFFIIGLAIGEFYPMLTGAIFFVLILLVVLIRWLIERRGASGDDGEPVPYSSRSRVSTSDDIRAGMARAKAQKEAAAAQPAPKAQTEPAPSASPSPPLLELVEKLRKENEQLRRRVTELEQAQPQRSPRDQEIEERSLLRMADALEEYKAVIAAQRERIEHLEKALVDRNLTLNEPQSSVPGPEPRAQIASDGSKCAGSLAEYVVFDTETTGIYPGTDELIEVAAVRYVGGEEKESFQSLLRPSFTLPEKVTALTGITPEQVKDAPSVSEIMPRLREFIGDSVLVAHNAPFDLKFLTIEYRKAGVALVNEFFDTLDLAKRAFPGLPSYKLQELKHSLQLGDARSHRALNDVRMTAALFEKCRTLAPDEKPGSAAEFALIEAQKPPKWLSASRAPKCSELTPTVEPSLIDPKGPLYGKTVVFTGAFSVGVLELGQMAVNAGAKCWERVTMKTDYLVCGEQDPEIVGADGLSSKQETAIRYNAEGKAKIKMIDEEQFLELLSK